MKHHIKDIFLILLISTVISIVYNILREDGLPFIKKSSEKLQVSDSLLFNNSLILKKTLKDTLKDIDTNDYTLKQDDTKKDTIINKELHTAKQQLDTQKVDIKISNKEKSLNHKEFLTVTYKQMLKIVNSKDFVIIDARRSSQFIAAHIPNAINICPLEEESILMDKIFSLPENKKYIIYCDGGNCDLSHDIANILVNLGFKNVFMYEGGWAEWNKNINT